MIQDRNQLVRPRESVIEYCRSIEPKFRKFPLIHSQILSIFNDFENGWIDVKGVVEEISAVYNEEPSLLYGFTPFLSPKFEIARTTSGFVVTASTAAIDYRDICISPSVPYIHGRVSRQGEFAVKGGGFSDIWTGTFENKKVAIKILRIFDITSLKYFTRLWRECRTWGQLSHPNVLPLLGICLERVSETILVPCLVSPWMDKGTVKDYIMSNPEVDRLPLLSGIAEGIRYLHTRDPPVVHGDLRAGNVLVSSDGTPLLSDFGLSRMLLEYGGMTTSTLAGSTRWMSPELLEAPPVTTCSDVWALGMTIIEVSTGEPPYQEVKNSTLLFQHILKRQLPLRPNDFNDKLWGIFLHCCAFEPSERPMISSIADEISKLLSPVTVAYQSSSSTPSIAREDLRASTNPSPDPIITNPLIQRLGQDIKRERQTLSLPPFSLATPGAHSHSSMSNVGSSVPTLGPEQEYDMTAHAWLDSSMEGDSWSVSGSWGSNAGGSVAGGETAAAVAGGLTDDFSATMQAIASVIERWLNTRSMPGF